MVPPENLKTQLAIAVRSIRWSYAIFWSISPSDEGVLEWKEGYYNGDIKTRKTIQVSDFDADQLGLLRSEQLRELYGSLSDGESNLQSKRPSAALSPEDLTDTEWYYLVCMSFQFNIGQGLPGSTFANGQPTWLSDAPCEDSKIFSRCLLAKSASIKTVVCFPYLDGVIEMGVTEMVEEDPSLIEHVKASYLTNPSASFSMIPMSGSENLGPNETDECDHEGANSQMQSWLLMDEEFSNCIMQNATSSSECMSHSFLNSGNLINELEQQQQQRNHTRKGSGGGGGSIVDHDQTDDSRHYKGVVASLLKTSNRFLIDTRYSKLENQESSFVGWRKNSHVQTQNVNPQRLLKKILFEVPRMYEDCLLNSRKKGHHVEVDSSHTLSERRRRERISDRFSVLGSLLPTISKVDKVSILDNTIGYVMELEKRIAELESCCSDSGLGEQNERIRTRPRTKRKLDETSEEIISNNIGKQHNSINKRKPGLDEINPSNNSTDKVKVTVNEKDLIIEIRCLWRESLLLDVMDTMGRLHLDSHSVHSSKIDGFLSITIKSKFTGSGAGSAGMITEAVQRVVWKN